MFIDIGLAYQAYQKSHTPVYDLISVKKGDAVEQVSVTGTVEPSSKIDLQFTTSGRVVDIKVKTGDKVSAGQVLVSLDTSDLSYQAQAARANLEIAQARLNQFLAGASAQDIAATNILVINARKSLDDARVSLSDAQQNADNALESAFLNAQTTIDSALLTAQNALIANNDVLTSSKLAGALSGGNPQFLRDARDLEPIARANFNSAELASDNLKSNFSESNLKIAIETSKLAVSSTYDALGKTYDSLVATISSFSLPQADIDFYKESISRSRANLNSSLSSLGLLSQNIASQKTINQANINLAQAKVTQAEGQLESALAQLALKEASPRNVDIELYRAQVRQALANLEQIQNQINQKSLLAPIDGIVTDVLVERGELAGLSGPVVSMNSLSSFEIESDIAESEIAKLNLGNPVKITFDAFGEEEIWEGKVVKIDPAQTVVQGVVYYKATIGLSSNDERIKSGMTANLDIETKRSKDTLLIPARAIKETDGKKFVNILSGQEVKEIEIETGIRDYQGEVEVVLGLKEGDRLAIEKKK